MLNTVMSLLLGILLGVLLVIAIIISVTVDYFAAFIPGLTIGWFLNELWRKYRK